jgi:FecR protein.
MRKPTLLLLAFIAFIALPSYARDRSHSYVTFDDGGTVIRQSDDGRDVDARVNMPVFPGDEVTTSRRGRVEIRMADGNVIALDRSTSVLFKSILDSYDGDSEQTVVELRYGHVAIQRDDETRQLLRLDTANASYAASDIAIYAVEAGAKSQDRVTVFDGTMEVRTPARTTRVREGEEARVDDGGIYDLVSARNTADEFERWFLQRASRNSTASGRYLDRSLAYSEADLGSNGSWVFASNFGGWCWRPHVLAGWRPYNNGYWRHSPGGVLVWVSYDPWGWVPYHYGRWAYEAAFGWVWLPGAAYAPAWVYWMYGPSYIGWAPMGWYDCYRPYYDWAYRPYARAGIEFGGGWSGRVRPGEVDLRPWTFVTPDTLMHRHIDQASLAADVIRERLRRDGNSGLVTSSPARFSRNEIKDPNAAVGNVFRRGIGSGTGKEGSGSAADMTPFFRRDPELSNSIRERVVRAHPVEGNGGGVVLGGRTGAPSGVPTPGTGGTLEGRVNRGADGNVPRSETPVGIVRDGRSTSRDDVPTGVLRRGDTPSGTTSTPAAGSGSNSNNNDWRHGRAVDGAVHRGDATQTPATDTTRHEAAPADRGSNNGGAVRRGEAPSGEATSSSPARPDNWRGRAVGRHEDASTSSSPAPAGESNSRDVPRRIIDGIGGAHISRGETPSKDAPRKETAAPSSEPRSRESTSRDSGRGSEREHSSPPPRTERSSPPPSSSSSQGKSSSHESSGSHESSHNDSGHSKKD